MKKHDLIDGIQTVMTFALIFCAFWLAMVLFAGCGSTQMCAAYKDKPKVERTEQKSRASDPKPKISRGYVNYMGTK